MSDSVQTAGRVVELGARAIGETVGGPARLRVILLLAAVLALDSADKATVSAVAGSLKQVFNIGNLEIGLLIAATSFIGAVFTLPIGILVDRTRRIRILIIAVILWTVAMVVSGTATSFTYLLVTRIVLGGVTAAAAPTLASLTGDFFPARERSRIYGMILAGELVGVGLGYFFAGEISSWLNWRWPFFLMAVPSAALVWALWRFLPEPARGGQSWIYEGDEDIRSDEEVRREHRQEPTRADGNEGEEGAGQSGLARQAARYAGARPRQDLVLDADPTGRSLWWAIGYVLRIPTYVLLIIASALGYYFFAGVRAFGMIYLTEHYGVSRSTMSALVVVIGLGTLAGVIFGGRFSQWLLGRRWLTIRIDLPGVALFVAVLLIAPAVWTTNVYLGIGLFTLGAAALAAANPAIDAARLDIIHPRLWGRAESGRMALRAGLEGGAPLLFGLMSDWLGGGESGLQWTFLLMLIPVLVASSLAVPARRTYLRDVATASASLKALSGRTPS